MGENLEVPGRMAVRTPMQWDRSRNGGFSTAAPSRLATPLVGEGYGPEFVNVADQRHDPDSLLTFVSTLTRRYRQCPELGWGTLRVLQQPHADVLAHTCTWGDGTLLALHNLGPDPRVVPVALQACGAEHRLVDLLVDGETALDPEGRAELRLEGWGYRWLRVVAPDSRRLR